jgi:hypothetical protein
MPPCHVYSMLAPAWTETTGGWNGRIRSVLPSRVELEIVRVIDTPDATHIRYRVRR